MSSPSVTALKGIGEKTAALFAKLNIGTLEDLVQYYPRTYERFDPPVAAGQLEEGRVQAAMLQVGANVSVTRVKHLQIIRASGRDVTGTVGLSWFNMPYLKNTLKPGSVYVFRGRVSRGRGGLSMEQPLLYTPENYGAIQGRLHPVYSLTKGLTSKTVSQAVEQALEQMPERKELLPDWIRKEYQLAEENFAVRQIHFPDDENQLRLARRRLVFDEFFLFILQVQRLRERREKKQNPFSLAGSKYIEQVLARLPYQLTGAQRRALNEVTADMEGEGLMNRLIQGDVGSGKTIIAFLALLKAAEHGCQGAIMAPTEVLARQHYEGFTALIRENGLPVRTELLTGSMTAKEKRQACERIRNHEADIIVGTHALIQEGVDYHSLALVVTDEQHRFGVRQRETLSQKGRQEEGRQEPHTLVMSATPIPRTLAIILYGDLDISVIDEMPASRLPVKNCVVGPDKLAAVYQFVKKQTDLSRQAYVICPMVEESEAIEGENVNDYVGTVRSYLPDTVTVACLHGKMKAKEKNRLMEEFAEGKIQVLVSTTVVEVGVNVPNATVIVIENAERFGLAQLHQLRGRVGRGKAQSYCIFINRSDSRNSQKRLEILNHSNDGFYIASEDLKLRGPGDFFGVRQSGLMEFELGDIFTDANVLRDASAAAAALHARDPELEQPEHGELRRFLERHSDRDFQNISL